jgi:hypothetical protein
MKRYEATKYQSYARECLRQAEAADTPERREKLLELSRIWMEAALHEEMHHLRRGPALIANGRTQSELSPERVTSA